jgi:hypothetical protein
VNIAHYHNQLTAIETGFKNSSACNYSTPTLGLHLLSHDRLNFFIGNPVGKPFNRPLKSEAEYPPFYFSR